MRWLLLSACLVTVLCILAGRSPQQFAMPILFPVGLGVLIGLALGEMGRILLIRKQRLTVAVTVLATIAAFVVITVQWHGHYRAKTAAWFRDHPVRQDPIGPQLSAALDRAPDGESRKDRESRLAMKAELERSRSIREANDARRRESLTFAGYLRDRWSNFGPLKDLPQPWPVILWSLELLFAGGLAGLIQRKTNIPEETTRENSD